MLFKFFASLMYQSLYLSCSDQVLDLKTFLARKAYTFSWRVRFWSRNLPKCEPRVQNLDAMTQQNHEKNKKCNFLNNLEERRRKRSIRISIRTFPGTLFWIIRTVASVNLDQKCNCWKNSGTRPRKRSNLNLIQTFPGTFVLIIQK